MKRFLAILAIGLIFFACSKKSDSGCNPVSPDKEASTMTSFCTASNITYTIDSNGIFYQVMDPGSGSRPGMDSTVTVTYTTSLLNGQVIDDHSSTPLTLPLNQFIEGWRIAIPYIQEGGHIKMVVPSSLAYGCTGYSGVIPANSPLYFDIVLVDVSN